jgi:hypothetical protein
MIRHRRKGLVLVMVALGVARAAGAQTVRDPEARQGFYVSAGAGANETAAWDKGQRNGTALGLAYTLRLGEMLTDRWGLGLAIEGGNTAHNGVTSVLFGLALEGQARLWRHLAAHAGVGLAAASVDDPSRIGDETHGTYGSLLTASLSYDAFFTNRPSGGWAVTPAFALRAVPGGDVRALAAVASVSLSWWSGLPPRELRQSAPAPSPP